LTTCHDIAYTLYVHYGNGASVPAPWQTWDVIDICFLKDFYEVQFIMDFHIRAVLYHMYFACFHALCQEPPRYMVKMAKDIPLRFHGELSKGEAVAKGMQATLSMENAIPDHWFNRVINFLTDDNESFLKELHQGCQTHCFANMHQVCDWKTMPLFQRVSKGWGWCFVMEPILSIDNPLWTWPKPVLPLTIGPVWTFPEPIHVHETTVFTNAAKPYEECNLTAKVLL